jgi:hypothetical protein
VAAVDPFGAPDSSPGARPALPPRQVGNVAIVLLAPERHALETIAYFAFDFTPLRGSGAPPSDLSTVGGPHARVSRVYTKASQDRRHGQSLARS